VSEARVAALVGLLDRVRERSRSTWPALVDAHPDDEALGHAAFAELDESAPEVTAYEPGDDDVLVESSPRIKLVARAELHAPTAGPTPLPVAPALEHAEAPAPEARDEHDEAPLLEVLGERALGDVAEAEIADAVPLLAHVTLGELLEASLALRPRPDAW
jgi:hypothetical protein